MQNSPPTSRWLEPGIRRREYLSSPISSSGMFKTALIIFARIVEPYEPTAIVEQESNKPALYAIKMDV